MRNIILLLACSLFVISACKQSKKSADLLIYNAHIQSVDSAFNIYEAMIIEGGVIKALGEKEALLQEFSPRQTADMQGKFIYPGLYDAHCHFVGLAQVQERWLDLTGTLSFAEIIDKLIAFEKEHSENQWILGRGWDQNDWENQSFPSKKLLDSLYPHKYVVLTRIDGHAVLCNQNVLDYAKINNKSTIPGGEILKNGDQLTGVLMDNAADSIKSLIPEMQNAVLAKALLGAQKSCLSVGLTTVVDAGLAYQSIQFIDSLQSLGDLKIRMYAMLSSRKEDIRYAQENGIYKTDKMHVQSVKVYADGALGSRGACLLHPYSDLIHHYGLLIHDPEELKELYQEIYEAGFQANTHAIGDSAVRLVLNSYAQFLEPNNDRRWRIEHSQVVNPQDLEKYKNYKIIPAINTTHATSDMYWAEERLGAERIHHAYAYHDLLEQNGWLPNGSDFPIESVNPILGFYAGVARKDLNHYPEGGFQKENALSRKEALKAMTIWAAKSCFEEKERGSLEVNKLADFVVLNQDLLQCSEDRIPQTQVLKTYIGGEKVYQRD